MSEKRPHFDPEAKASPEKQANIAPVEKSSKKIGWQNETAARQGSIIRFLQRHLQTSLEDRAKYDSIRELHFSGMNWDVMTKITQGGAKVNEIAVLYKEEKPESIHVVFESEGKGHYIDVYLQGQALQDYLASESAS